MSLHKQAQTMADDDLTLAQDDLWDSDLMDSLLAVDEEDEEKEEHPEEELELTEEPEDEFVGHGEIEIEVDDEPRLMKEFDFTLPLVPGGEHQEEIPEEEEEVEVEDEGEAVDENLDLWDWKRRGGVAGFMTWLQYMMTHIPTHTGYDTTGLERTISYMEELDKNISQAVRADYKGELDVRQIEKARAEIHNGIMRLKERLDKIMTTKYNRKKKADGEYELVKEAQKTPNISGIVISVPLFISHLARVCVNSSVSAGHDIEKTFNKLADRYSLSEREKAELITLLSDMNYPILKDRGLLNEDIIDTKSPDNYDWSQQFPA